MRPDLRVPPQNVDLEMCVLGGIMLEPQVYPQVADILKPASFYLEGNRAIFETAGLLHSRGIPPDAQSVLDELRARGLIELVGGPGVVMGMLNAVISAANVEQHAQKVQEKAILRETIRGCTKVIEECYKQELGLDKTLELAEQIVLELARQTGGRHELQPIAQTIAEYWEVITERDTRREEMRAEGVDDSGWVPGLYSPYPGVNRAIKGFMPETLTTIAARSSTGKTALLLNIAHFMGTKMGYKVGFITLEQSMSAINNRLLALGTRGRQGRSLKILDTRRVDQVGEPLSAFEWSVLTKSYKALSEANIVLDEPSRQWEGQKGIKAALKSLQDVHVDVIFIDYIGCMGKIADSDWESQGIHAANLKGFAKSSGIPLITAAQVSRNAYVGNKRNGWIDQHNMSRSEIIFNESDNVIAIEPLLLDKESVAEGDPKAEEPWCPTRNGKWNEQIGEKPLPGFLGVIKARDGACGWVPIDWYPHATLFVERSLVDEAPE